MKPDTFRVNRVSSGRGQLSIFSFADFRGGFGGYPSGGVLPGELLPHRAGIKHAPWDGHRFFLCKY
jgi:hypothetical protein